jgi:4-hydroxy-tetrahydrodipicolinate synthase
LEQPSALRGVIAPVVTPFAADLRPDTARLVRMCRWLVARDAGLAVFGTTSEANSLSVGEKLALLDVLVDAGLPPARMMPGTGCCAFTDTVELTRRAVVRGCGGVLMLPPFYYKGVTDDGLFASYSEVIQRVGDARLRIYLYHIPQVSQVPLSPALIERLLAAYPGTIAGIKDSSGDWSSVSGLLERFAARGFAVYPGSEMLLLAAMRGGGAGCISAQANVNPAAIVQLYRGWRQPDAEARQAALDALRAALVKFPVIAALKALLAHFTRDEAWATVRPPLVALNAEQRTALLASLPAGLSLAGWAPEA